MKILPKNKAVKSHHYLACDLGAESGRVMLGALDGGRVSLEEIHRFPNGPVVMGASMRWDIPRIFNELKTGLRQAASRGIPIASLSTDSWGVDYVLFSKTEPMLTLPFHYRDSRTDGRPERAFRTMSAREIFAETGIQFMQLNTLYQFLDDHERRPGALKLADRFLPIGDYFNFLFCSLEKSEISLASTTQMFNPKRHEWSSAILRRFKLSKKLFPKIVPSGTRLGPLLPDISREVGLRNVEVIATCSHDTGAAVAAVPAQGKDWAYLSSGTWSLLGIESPKPIISDGSRKHNFTNEAGFGGTTRFLKNIVGLWIVQECRRAWEKSGKKYNYDEITAMAREAAPLQSMIHPNAARFLKPDDMPEKVMSYCRETGQKAPKGPGAMIRSILESLAFLYRQTLDEISEITGVSPQCLHIVGGGSQNRLLNQFSANAAQIPVLAGPVEATALGNVLIQAIALGHLDSLEELRQVVRHSFPLESFQPQDAPAWQEAYRRFRKLAP